MLFVNLLMMMNWPVFPDNEDLSQDCMHMRKKSALLSYVS